MVRAGDLRERVTVCMAMPTLNDLSETEYQYTALRTIWASVAPSSGRTEMLPGDTERAEITHRVVIRAASLPDLCREMCFVVRGQRLDVMYWYPVYNRRGWMEIFCRMRQGERAVDSNGA